jgi:hypothetical protein
MVACGTSGLLGGRFVPLFVADNSLIPAVPVFALAFVFFAVAFFATGCAFTGDLLAVFLVLIFFLLKIFLWLGTGQISS